MCNASYSGFQVYVMYASYYHVKRDYIKKNGYIDWSTNRWLYFLQMETNSWSITDPVTRIYYNLGVTINNTWKVSLCVWIIVVFVWSISKLKALIWKCWPWRRIRSSRSLDFWWEYSPLSCRSLSSKVTSHRPHGCC